MKIFSLLFVLTLNSYAESIPTLPEGCFDNSSFCSEWDIVRLDRGQGEDRYIRVLFAAEVSADEYPSAQSIVDVYFDFEKWNYYTRNSQDVVVNDSRKLESVVNEEKGIVTAYIDYTGKAPFPINKLKIREITEHKRVRPYEGAVLTWEYDLLPPPHVIPGADEFEKPVGLKQKFGKIHITYDEERGIYTLILDAYIIPVVDILPKVAAPYIERSIISVAKGMLGID